MGIGNHPKFPDAQGDDLPRGQHGAVNQFDAAGDRLFAAVENIHSRGRVRAGKYNALGRNIKIACLLGLRVRRCRYGQPAQ